MAEGGRGEVNLPPGLEGLEDERWNGKQKGGSTRLTGGSADFFFYDY